MEDAHRVFDDVLGSASTPAGSIPDIKLAPGSRGAKQENMVRIACAGKLDLGQTPLAWAVLKPTAEGKVACSSECDRARGHTAGRRRPIVRQSAHVNPKASASKCSPGGSVRPETTVRIRERAIALFCEALDRGDSSQETAGAIVDAFMETHGAANARRLLLDLGASLRRNAALREEVVATGASVAARLVQQDPREWATDELRNKRSRWAEEALQELKPSGPIAACPCCGGRAVVATGTAGSGRAGRTTKAFIHYSCLEQGCGKSSHVKQD